MWPTGVSGTLWRAASVLVLALLLTSIVTAQNEPGPHEHIYLPPTYGATPLSTIISAEANYIAAQGDFLESAAIARRHNALAAEQEMRNAVQWVRTYFEMRALNRENRLKENPPYLDKMALVEQQMRRRIVDEPQLVSQKDPTDELNWLLGAICEVWLDYKYLPREQLETKVRGELELTDVRRIRLTDGSGSHGSEFAADQMSPLDVKWPVALRSPNFRELTKQFEAVRDQAVQESQSEGGLSWERFDQLKKAVDALSDKLQEEYPPERRRETKEFLDYDAGKRFLQTLAGGIFHMFEANDPHLFDRAHRFQGDTVAELIDYLYGSGLRFAHPAPGDENVYQKLFYDLRQAYLRLAAEQPEPPAKGP